jgi:hypothetical protein
MHIYTARVLDKIANPPNNGRPTWNSIKVGVFRVEDGKEDQIGEFVRNYPSFFNTFYYFRKDDREYALYSPDYTVTRILELPACKDIGGEEPHTHGFCPTDFYIPSYIEQKFTYGERVRTNRVNEPRPEDFMPKTTKYYPLDEKTGERIEIQASWNIVSPLLYYPFGFVAGCIWGDDSTWKIQYLDLSEAEKGIIRRDERFGYIILPRKLSLKDAIDMTDYLYDPGEEEPDTYITIDIQTKFDLPTGKRFDQH